MMKRNHSLFFFLILSLVATGFSRNAFAQESGAETTLPWSHAITINPIFAPLGTVHAEYEYAPASFENLTVGVATWIEYKNIQDSWLHLKLMYYPRGPFRGVALGLTGGVHHSYSDDAAKLSHDSSPVLGAIAQYNWLLGEDEQFLVGVGFGAEVPLKERRATSPLRSLNGNLRLVVGLLL